jgi:hypothetical protein
MRLAAIAVVLLIGCTEAPASQQREPLPGASANQTPPTRTLASTFIDSGSWTYIANSFKSQFASCKTDCRQLAYAEVVTRKQLIEELELEPPPGDGPVELPHQVQSLLDTVDAYVKMLQPGDAEIPMMRLLTARTLLHWRRIEALPLIETFLQEHHDENGEWAAESHLQLLMNQQRFDELRIWLAAFLADKTFVAKTPELRATLERAKFLLRARSDLLM